MTSAASPPGTIHPCFQPSTCWGTSSLLPIVASQPSLKFCGSTRIEGPVRLGRSALADVPTESRRTSSGVVADGCAETLVSERVSTRNSDVGFTSTSVAAVPSATSSSSQASRGTLRPRIRERVLARNVVCTTRPPMSRSGPLPQGNARRCAGCGLSERPSNLMSLMPGSSGTNSCPWTENAVSDCRICSENLETVHGRGSRPRPSSSSERSMLRVPARNRTSVGRETGAAGLTSIWISLTGRLLKSWTWSVSPSSVGRQVVAEVAVAGRDRSLRRRRQAGRRC